MKKEIYIVIGYKSYRDKEYTHTLYAFTTERAAEKYISTHYNKNIYSYMTIEQVELCN